MANLRTNNLSGEQGQNAYRGSVVFGGGDNSSAGLTIADNSDLELGSETNWTIEFWLWLNGPVHGDYDVILGKGSATGNNYEYFVEVMSDNTLDFFSTSTGSAWTFQQQISPVLSHDSWHHVAVVRNGSGSNSLKSYINGQEYGSFTAESIHTSAYPFGIGYFAGGNNLYSKVTVSNLRIVKGTSVYTAAFTPPFTELKAIPNTVLLCCQDSDNPFKEETGKTITGVGHLANGAVIHPRNNPPYGVDAGNTFGGPIQQSTQGYMCFPTGRTEERGRGRGLHAGGEAPSHSNIIDYIQIQSGGTAIDFGDLITLCNSCDGVSSNTRAVFCTFDSPNFNLMEFVTISTTGNGTDFGDQTVATGQEGTLSNQTRGLFAGGYRLIFYSTVEFITIATIGNGTDFGDLREAIVGVGGAADTTRGLFAGGVVPGAYRGNIDQFTIATTGNATDFGDLTVARRNPAGTSDSTRGVFFGGNDSGGTNVIDFVTIQSAGNATDFGDSTSNQADASGSSDSIRGVFSAGYYGAPALTNVIEKVIIQTTGNSVDYGDLSVSRIQGGSVSDSHGGLS